MDEADFAELDQSARVIAAIETSRNLAAAVDAAIHGDGYCLECEKGTEQVETRLKVNGSWKSVFVYPRWCCAECRKIWERDQ